MPEPSDCPAICAHCGAPLGPRERCSRCDPVRSVGVRAEFRVHKLNETGLARAEALAELFSWCLNEIERNVGPNADPRYVALTRTHLEHACFFAKKAMAGQYRFQEGNDPDAPSVLSPKVP